MRQLKITHSITNRDIKSLDKYLQDICSEELLTRRCSWRSASSKATKRHWSA